MTDLLDHARLYLALGFAVLPLHFPYERQGRRLCSCAREKCGQPAKHPLGRLVENGLKDASRDLEIVERWFTNTCYNIGIVTGAASRIVALDVDPRHDGDETLRALEAEHGELPETWRFLTGGGGEHILFLHPGRRIANNAGLLGSGIDVRGDGGYLVAPPSEHVSGRPYAISVDHHPEDLTLAQLPKWLFDRLAVDRKEETARKAAEWRSIAREGAADGERNVTIARLSGLLLGRRIDPHVCLELILAFNARRCNPPLPEDEVVATVASIARRENASRSKEHDHG